MTPLPRSPAVSNVRGIGGRPIRLKSRRNHGVGKVSTSKRSRKAALTVVSEPCWQAMSDHASIHGTQTEYSGPQTPPFNEPENLRSQILSDQASIYGTKIKCSGPRTSPLIEPENLRSQIHEACPRCRWLREEVRSCYPTCLRALLTHSPAREVSTL